MVVTRAPENSGNGEVEDVQLFVLRVGSSFIAAEASLFKD